MDFSKLTLLSAAVFLGVTKFAFAAPPTVVPQSAIAPKLQQVELVRYYHHRRYDCGMHCGYGIKTRYYGSRLDPDLDPGPGQGYGLGPLYGYAYGPVSWCNPFRYCYGAPCSCSPTW
jgi:hypothetical protein